MVDINIIRSAFAIVQCAATHDNATCVNCNRGCDRVNALRLVRDYIYDIDIQAEAEKLYDDHEFTCQNLFCTVATTCYEPDEQKKICTECIKERYFGNPNKPLYHVDERE